jgi:hypothetical protein
MRGCFLQMRGLIPAPSPLPASLFKGTQARPSFRPEKWTGVLLFNPKTRR